MNVTAAICVSLFLAVWMLLMAWTVGYFRFLGRKLRFGWRRIGPSPGNAAQGEAILGNDEAARPSEAGHEGFERRSRVEKSRMLLVQGLSFGLAAVLAAGILFAMASRFGVAFLIVGLVIIGAVLMVAHTRANVRYIIKVVRTTPCPRCGKLPMDYVAQSRDDRRLLVCTGCRTEWDMGPAAL